MSERIASRPNHGRRRGAALEDAILQAAWEELRQVGYTTFTMEAVAARAKTSKPVLYRRWHSRAELVIAALRRHAPLLSGEVPDTGSLRQDVLALLGRVSTGLSDIGRETLYGLAAEYFRGDQNAVSQVGIGAGEAAMRTILRRAAERGEIADRPLSDRVASLPVDLARHEMMFVSRGPVPVESLQEIVDEIFLPLLHAANQEA